MDLSRENLISIFNEVKEEREEIVKFDDEGTTYRLKLKEDLFLCLELSECIHLLYVEKILPDGIKIIYYDDFTKIQIWLIENLPILLLMK